MKSIYQEKQREKVVRLLFEENKIFYGGKGGGYFMRSNRDFVLNEYEKNLFKPILKESMEYFRLNGIDWWGGRKVPTGHTLSSQIACLNHLFAIRKDKQAVLSLLKNVSNDFIDVFLITTDKYSPAYIQFEAVSDNDYLFEEQLNRGSHCTSIDALIFAKDKDGKKWLIPIEWKYSEHYNNTDKSVEDRKGEPKGTNGKGIERLDRYCYNKEGRLIDNSKQLKSLPEYKNSVYFFEPFYQLMRQTLWAEEMIKNKVYISDKLTADNFLHLHVIPKENDDLQKIRTEKKYKCSGLDMESTWRKNLEDNSKYQIISPEAFMKNIDKKKYAELIDYLSSRYWSE